MTADEIDAESKALLITLNDIDGAKISSLDEDHDIYINVFMRCQVNEARNAAILARTEAKRKKEEMARMSAMAQQATP